MISYIVSVYDRIATLHACLASLACQHGPKEIIVCSNAIHENIIDAHGGASILYGARKVNSGRWGANSCYESAEIVAEDGVRGEWLCFPSDDSLYVAGFQKIMLDTAARTGADLVYCDCVYAVGSEINPWAAYSVLETQPKMGRIDKTCFILRRSLFKGFPAHELGYRDGALIEQLVKGGVKMAKAPGVLVVHQ